MAERIFVPETRENVSIVGKRAQPYILFQKKR